MTPAEEARFIELWQAGTAIAAMAQALGIPLGTVQSRAHGLRLQGKIQARPRGGSHSRSTPAHPGTPAIRRRHTGAHPGTPAADPTPVHSGTPSLPVPQPTPAHPSVPLSNEAAMRLLALLPDLEVMVAREQDRQRLMSTPIGTPRHTVKKTYVVDTLYVDLIDRYAQAEGGGAEGRGQPGLP